jgi:hypothetical protein
MYARACRQGYVDTVIDEDFSASGCGRSDSGFCKIKQLAGLQVTLSDL